MTARILSGSIRDHERHLLLKLSDCTTSSENSFLDDKPVELGSSK